MSAFKSVYAKQLASYVELRRQMGLRFAKQEGTLSELDRYLHEFEHVGPITQEMAQRFAFSVRDPTTTIPARRYLVVRQFTEYLATFDPSTPRLDPKAIRRVWSQPVPYVLNEDEIDSLLRHTAEISQRHPVLNRAVRAMIGLGACAGLRLGEVIGLDLPDVDLETGVLVIRRTKLDKDRLVPVHPTMLEVLRAYAAVREQMPVRPAETAFFLSTRGARFTVDHVDRLFRGLVRRIDLHGPHGKPPTFRSLRHTFAVRRLVAWYRAGANVQALLPALATYMGHVHYTSTAYYPTATAELLGVAADRLCGVTKEANHGTE